MKRNPGLLFNRINLHAMNDSGDSAFFLSVLSRVFLTNSANVLRNSDDAVPNKRDVKIFFQPSASRPHGPDPLFVGIAAFKMRDSFISSLDEHVVSVLAVILLASGCSV